MSLLADYNMPFAAALVLMVLLGLVQVFGLGSALGDTDLDADADGGFADALLGEPLDRWVAAAIAAVAGLPVTGVLVRPIAAILPGDETSAVGLDSLVGRRAKIVTGRAAAGHPARAEVHDHHGQPHYVMVEPHEVGSEMLEGDEVLLVRREGEAFYGVALQERRLAPL